MTRSLAILFTGLLLTACAPADTNSNPSAALPAGSSVDAMARAILTQIQPISIAENREYCGSIVRRANGTLYATNPQKGTLDSCGIPDYRSRPTFRTGDVEVADYHTHSAYSPNYDSEVPSPTDMLGAGEYNIAGYVGTPGGRMWFIRADGLLAYQICSVGCLPADPKFVDEVGRYTVPSRLTYAQLLRR